ncbi:expressed protein [Phakopsora pachyrhizi]|uniref:Expressed protein n=1 Tax=Phakopsora pachyrhizi TaxID=170000 RepID=A0AAV0BQD6_PHAPC|nr:expressed protein [Phakopsora pachyrhizi]
MARFVSMKIKGRLSKSDQLKERHHQPVAIPPTLELSLPDSRSFRFSILRSQSDLVSFQQQLKQQRAMGQITQQDESILLNEFKRQYAHQSAETKQETSPGRPPNSFPAKASSIQINPNGSNSLFSAKAAARDAAYLRKTMKLSDDKGVRTLSNSSIKQVDELHELQSIGGGANYPISPKQLHRISQAIDRILDHHLIKNKPESISTLSVPAKDDAEVLQTTRSVFSHDSSSSLYTASASVSGTELLCPARPLANNPTNIPKPISQCEDAETRVHEELFKALSATISSDPALSSTSLNRPSCNSASFIESPVSTLSFSSPTPPDLSIKNDSPLSFGDGRRFSFSSDHSEPFSVCSSSFDPRDQLFHLTGYSSDIDFDSSHSVPITVLLEDESIQDLSHPINSLSNRVLDRNQVIPFTDVHYQDLMLAQELLASVQSQPPTSNRKGTLNSLPVSAQAIISDRPPHHALNRATSSSTTNSSCKDFQRTSSLQDKAVLVHPSERSTSLRPKTNKSSTLKTHSPSGAVYQSLTLDELSNSALKSSKSPSIGSLDEGFNQLSPSLSMSPDFSSFPLTPPINDLRENRPSYKVWNPTSLKAENGFEPNLKEDQIPKNHLLLKASHSFQNPSTVKPNDYLSSQLSLQRNNQKLDQIEIMNGEYQSSNTHNSQSRPNICRNARPIPTSILFRDVEAQAVAANVALRKAAGNKFENASKGPSKKKKTIKINQIGAPTLLSASADLNTIRLQSASHNKKESINRELHFSLPNIRESATSGQESTPLDNPLVKVISQVSVMAPSGSASPKSKIKWEKASHSGIQDILHRHSRHNQELDLSIEPQAELVRSGSYKNSISWINPFDNSQTSPETFDRESMNVSPTGGARNSTSSKHQSGPLKSLRKLMGGARKSFKGGPGYSPHSVGRENESFETKVEAHDTELIGSSILGELEGSIEPLKISKFNKDLERIPEASKLEFSHCEIKQETVNRNYVSVNRVRKSEDSVNRLFDDLGFHNNSNRKGLKGSPTCLVYPSKILNQQVELTGERRSISLSESAKGSIILEAEKEEDIFVVNDNYQSELKNSHLCSSDHRLQGPVEVKKTIESDEIQAESEWGSDEKHKVENESEVKCMDAKSVIAQEIDDQTYSEDYAASILDFYGGAGSSTGECASSVWSQSLTGDRLSGLSFTGLSQAPVQSTSQIGTLIEENFKEDEIEAPVSQAENDVKTNEIKVTGSRIEDSLIENGFNTSGSQSKRKLLIDKNGTKSDGEVKTNEAKLLELIKKHEAHDDEVVKSMDDEVFGLVNELKKSDSRYSKFITRQKSQRRRQLKELNKILPGTGTSALSNSRNVINDQIIKSNDLMSDSKLRESSAMGESGKVLFDDDEEEAEIWKQILDS